MLIVEIALVVLPILLVLMKVWEGASQSFLGLYNFASKVSETSVAARATQETGLPNPNANPHGSTI